MAFRPGPLRAAAALAAGFVVVRVVYRVLFHGADGSGAVHARPSRGAPARAVRARGAVRAGDDGRTVGCRRQRPADRAHDPRLRPAQRRWWICRACSHAARAADRCAGSRARSRSPGRPCPRWPTRCARCGSPSDCAASGAGCGCWRPCSSARSSGRRRSRRRSSCAGSRGGPSTGDCEHPVEVRGAGCAIAVPARGAVRVPDLVLAPGVADGGDRTHRRGQVDAAARTRGAAHPRRRRHAGRHRAGGRPRPCAPCRRAIPPSASASCCSIRARRSRPSACATKSGSRSSCAASRRRSWRRASPRSPSESGSRTCWIGQLRGLSAGEATLVAIAAAIVEHPILLLVDEPLADLDAELASRIVALLDALAHEAGVCVVVAEHRVAEFAERGRPPGRARRRALRRTRPPHRPLDRARRRAPASAASARGTRGSRASTCATAGTSRSTGATSRVAAGEIVALVGPNGAGKSSLLAAIALPDAGAAVTDRRSPARGRRRGTTAARRSRPRPRPVGRPVRVRHRRRRVRACRPAGRQRRAARPSRGGRDSWAEPRRPTSRAAARHPRDLSLGERRCLAIALQLARHRAFCSSTSRREGWMPRPATSSPRRCTTSRRRVGRAHRDARSRVRRRGRLVVLPMRAGGSRHGAGPQALVVERRAAAGRRSRRAALAARSLDDSRIRPTRTVAGSSSERRARDDAVRRSPRVMARTLALIAANLVALAAFAWPLVATPCPRRRRPRCPPRRSRSRRSPRSSSRRPRRHGALGAHPRPARHARRDRRRHPDRRHGRRRRRGAVHPADPRRPRVRRPVRPAARPASRSCCRRSSRAGSARGRRSRCSRARGWARVRACSPAA